MLTWTVPFVIVTDIQSVLSVLKIFLVIYRPVQNLIMMFHNIQNQLRIFHYYHTAIVTDVSRL